MQELTRDDLDALATGAAVLGSGGGGCPQSRLLAAKHALEECPSVQLLGVDALADDALVVPVASVGAPMIGVERLMVGDEFDRLIDMVEEFTGQQVGAVVPAEIGGANALSPLFVAAKRRIPVADGDTVGRAFPKMEMSTCNLHGIAPNPLFLVDGIGSEAILQPANALIAERMVRQLAIAMGFRAFVAIYLMTGRQAKRALVRGSVSRALALGHQLLEQHDPHSLVAQHGGTIVGTGTIIDVDQQMKGGFLSGSFTLEESDGRRVIIDYQNEFLRARTAKETLVATPHILTLLDHETALPILSERLQYGLRVHLIQLPAPAQWRDAEGMALVGPKAFGYGGTSDEA